MNSNEQLSDQDQPLTKPRRAKNQKVLKQPVIEDVSDANNENEQNEQIEDIDEPIQTKSKLSVFEYINGLILLKLVLSDHNIALILLLFSKFYLYLSDEILCNLTLIFCLLFLESLD
jgi:hypothetical protein